MVEGFGLQERYTDGTQTTTYMDGFPPTRTMGVGQIRVKVEPVPGFEPGTHWLVFNVRENAEPTSIDFTVVHALEIELGDMETLSLSHNGCYVDGTFDESVVAVLTPPTGGPQPDIDLWPATRAWKFDKAGLVELRPDGVTCELAGE